MTEPFTLVAAVTDDAARCAASPSAHHGAALALDDRRAGLRSGAPAASGLTDADGTPIRCSSTVLAWPRNRTKRDSSRHDGTTAHESRSAAQWHHA